MFAYACAQRWRFIRKGVDHTFRFSIGLKSSILLAVRVQDVKSRLFSLIIKTHSDSDKCVRPLKAFLCH